jgi:hypothetical protein
MWKRVWPPCFWSGDVGTGLVSAMVVSLSLFFGSALAQAQNKIADEVSVVVTHGRVLGLGSGSGFVGARLNAGEPVVFTESKGLNAVAQTPGRLLGFSGPSQRWSVQRLDVSENVQSIQVTPRMLFVRTDKRLFGFQGAVGRWKIQDLGVQEEHRKTIVQDHLAVVVTDRRVLGFSAFTGGFFAETLSSDETIDQVEGNDNIIVLFTSARKLVFRSGLAVWAEIP